MFATGVNCMLTWGSPHKSQQRGAWLCTSAGIAQQNKAEQCATLLSHSVAKVLGGRPTSR
eukprot:10832492-Karenia_brevis.AAC.1